MRLTQSEPHSHGEKMAHAVCETQSLCWNRDPFAMVLATTVRSVDDTSFDKVERGKLVGSVARVGSVPLRRAIR